MAVERATGHIHQEEKSEKEECRLSDHYKSTYYQLNDGKTYTDGNGMS